MKSSESRKETHSFASCGSSSSSCPSCSSSFCPSSSSCPSCSSSHRHSRRHRRRHDRHHRRDRRQVVPHRLRSGLHLRLMDFHYHRLGPVPEMSVRIPRHPRQDHRRYLARSSVEADLIRTLELRSRPGGGNVCTGEAFGLRPKIGTLEKLLCSLRDFSS